MTCRVYLFLKTSLGDFWRPAVTSMPFALWNCPRARLQNHRNASAIVSTTRTALARITLSALPISPSLETRSRLDILASSSPTLLLNYLWNSLSFGQSTSTWVTLLRRTLIGHRCGNGRALGKGKKNQFWPVRSYVNRYDSVPEIDPVFYIMWVRPPRMYFTLNRYIIAISPCNTASLMYASLKSP
jgi:hypothetical protein